LEAVEMATKQQMTGMRGVYLVAAELCRRGFIVAPTSRSARGADLLVTDQNCDRAFSVQVKTNARTFTCWLINIRAKALVSRTLIYVLVNIKKGGELTEFFVVPSKVISQETEVYYPPSRPYAFSYERACAYKDRWDLFGSPTER
jgi:hypothetical protein